MLAAYAIERLRFKGAQHAGLAIYLAYLVPPTILFIPLATLIFQFGPVRQSGGADPDLSDIPDSVLHLAADRLLQVDTLRVRGMRADRRGVAAADPAADHAAARGAGVDLGRDLRLHRCRGTEFIYALAFIQSTEKKTVPVAILTELVTGDVYQWGSLMAGSLLGSVPVAIIYSFFVEYYVSSMTGAVKE